MTTPQQRQHQKKTVKELETYIAELERSLASIQVTMEPAEAAPLQPALPPPAAALMRELALAVRNLIKPNPERIQILLAYDKPSRGDWNPDDIKALANLYTAIRVHATVVLAKAEQALKTHAPIDAELLELRAQLDGDLLN